MRDLLELATKEGVCATVGVVDDLVGNHKRSRYQIAIGYTAHGVHGNDPGGTRLFKRPDIGAVVDLMWRNSVTRAMARQEHHLVAAQLPVHHWRGRFAMRCADYFAPRDTEILEICEAAAPNNCHRGHICSPTRCARSSCLISLRPLRKYPERSGGNLCSPFRSQRHSDPEPQGR